MAVFYFAMFNALFVLIVFMLTLNKDVLHIDWPLGIKENITITEANEVSRRPAPANTNNTHFSTFATDATDCHSYSH